MNRKDLVEFKLDVGCGQVPKAGYIGVDTVAWRKDIVKFNLEDLPGKKMPFYDNSISEIWCSHTLEHVDNVLDCVDEFYRILKPGGKLTVRVPYFAHPASHTPIHKNYWGARGAHLFTNEYFETKTKWSNFKLTYTWGISHPIRKLMTAPYDLFIKAFGFYLYERLFCYVAPVFEIVIEVEKA